MFPAYYWNQACHLPWYFAYYTLNIFPITEGKCADLSQPFPSFELVNCSMSASKSPTLPHIPISQETGKKF